MAHAGTMLGGSAQTKQNGTRWPAITLALALAVAAIAGVWFASSTGLRGGTAKPESVTYINRYGPPSAVNRSYDQIEAQRGMVALPNNLSVRRGYASAAELGVVAFPDNLSVRRGYAIAAQPAVTALPDNLSVRRGYPTEVRRAIGTPSGSDRIEHLRNVGRRPAAGGAAATQLSVIALPDNLSVRRGYATVDTAAMAPLSPTWRTVHLGR